MRHNSSDAFLELLKCGIVAEADLGCLAMEGLLGPQQFSAAEGWKKKDKISHQNIYLVALAWICHEREKRKLLGITTSPLARAKFHFFFFTHTKKRKVMMKSRLFEKLFFFYRTKRIKHLLLRKHEKTTETLAVQLNLPGIWLWWRKEARNEKFAHRFIYFLMCKL